MTSKPRWKWNTVQEMIETESAMTEVRIDDAIEGPKTVKVQPGQIIRLWPWQRVMH